MPSRSTRISFLTLLGAVGAFPWLVPSLPLDAQSPNATTAAPRVVLRATHEGALSFCSLADLKKHAIDLA